MGDMLSQAEIDALLSGTPLSALESAGFDTNVDLTPQEIDALGEVGNISMGASATALFMLLGHKVTITTPNVTVTTWEELSKEYVLPYVAVRVEYTNGLIGTNLLILKEDDAKVITDLMMGGEGINIGGDLTDLHLSAISEAMNQMIGSAATSMSSMFDKKINISPPKAFIIHFDTGVPLAGFETSQKIVKIAFKMVVGNLIDSEIMQLLPISFAKDMVDSLLKINRETAENIAPKAQTPVQPQQQFQTRVQPPQPERQGGYYQEPQYSPPPLPPQQSYGSGHTDYGQIHYEAPKNRESVNIQPAQFQSFDDSKIMIEKKNISLIMDVPLQVTVELGRTQRLIKDILEFGPGSIIELDKLAGEPVDILVNGKVIAKGEVVVIDESFGVRITEIIHPSKRL